MKNLCVLALFACSLFLSVPGCGPGGTTSVTEDAEQSAIEAYQEQEAADQAAMEKSMQAAEGAGTEGAATEGAATE